MAPVDYRIKIAILIFAAALFVAAGIAALVLISVVGGKWADSKDNSSGRLKAGGLVLVLAIALRAMIPAIQWLSEWLRRK